MAPATLRLTSGTQRTIADLVDQLGDIPLERIRLHPPPGTATIDDLIQNNDAERATYCELIDGVLVEKAAMYLEDSLTTVLARFLHEFLWTTRMGKGFTAGAIYQMIAGNFRLPDFTVCLKDKFPSGKVERVPYVDFAPDLAVEVLSRSNTRNEIERKRRELFASGTRLIWVVDPDRRTVAVYTSPEECTTLLETDILTGGDVLPGFELSIAEWFRHAEEV
ncbi:MAG: Uma2 family endonuclease [Planctomycetaceae bacterium]|nr:Uma2 family endonuclease [Planctomycetaceae bacterium]